MRCSYLALGLAIAAALACGGDPETRAKRKAERKAERASKWDVGETTDPMTGDRVVVAKLLAEGAGLFDGNGDLVIRCSGRDGLEVYFVAGEVLDTPDWRNPDHTPLSLKFDDEIVYPMQADISKDHRSAFHPYADQFVSSLPGHTKLHVEWQRWRTGRKYAAFDVSKAADVVPKIREACPEKPHG